MDLDALLESIETEADWPEDAKAFQAIEKSLKCSICHATMRSAVLLSNCGHSFCSYCIRQFLLKEKICPLCRERATESDIVRNIAMNEVIDVFKKQRSDLVQLCRRLFQSQADVPNEKPASASPPRSRKRSSPTPTITIVDDSETDSDFEESFCYLDIMLSHSSSNRQSSGDCLCECPLCGEYFQQSVIEVHLSCTFDFQSHASSCDGTAKKKTKRFNGFVSEEKVSLMDLCSVAEFSASESVLSADEDIGNQKAFAKVWIADKWIARAACGTAPSVHAARSAEHLVSPLV